MKAAMILCASAALLAGCGAAPARADGVKLFKSLGSRQCEGGGSSAEALAESLRAAGITVRSTQCGTDGRMRPQVCGAGDGRIVVVEVAASDEAKAAALGFNPLARLPDASVGPCP